MSLNPKVVVTAKLYAKGEAEISGEFSVLQDIFSAAKAISEGDIVQRGGPGNVYSLIPSRGLFDYLYDFVARTHGSIRASARTIPDGSFTTLLIDREDFDQAVSEYAVLVQRQHAKVADDLAAFECEMLYVRRLMAAVVPS